MTARRSSNSSSISITTICTTTSTNATTPSAQPPSNSSTSHPGQKHPHYKIGGTKGAVIAGIVGFTLVIGFIIMGFRRAQMDSEFSGIEYPISTPMQAINDNPSTVVGQNSTFPEAMAASRPFPHWPNASITDSNYSLLVAPSAPPSTVERGTAQVPSSDTRGEDRASTSSSGVATYATSRVAQGVCQPCVCQLFVGEADTDLLPPPNIWNSRQGIESGVGLYCRSDIADWTSVDGGSAPPSYHTRSEQ